MVRLNIVLASELSEEIDVTSTSLMVIAFMK